MAVSYRQPRCFAKIDKVHTYIYIIGHYNPKVRIINLVSHTRLGGLYQLHSPANLNFFFANKMAPGVSKGF